MTMSLFPALTSHRAGTTVKRYKSLDDTHTHAHTHTHTHTQRGVYRECLYYKLHYLHSVSELRENTCSKKLKAFSPLPQTFYMHWNSLRYSTVQERQVATAMVATSSDNTAPTGPYDKRTHMHSHTSF